MRSLERHLGVFVVFCLGWLVTTSTRLTAAPARFVQDRFVIGLWVAPQVDGDGETRYRELAEANFTLVVGGGGLSPDEQLGLCERFGLKAILVSPPTSTAGLTNPAYWGALLVDEPNQSQFAELANKARTFREQQPGRFGYINLFPNYATPAQLGAPNYEEYVAAFMREVQPEVLSMDHYPVMRPDADGRKAYAENLDVFRRHSLAAGVAFWNYFYSMPFNDRLDPTEAQIRWQIFTSLAYGAKGVLYFCYWTPGRGNGGTGEFPKGGAILTAEGRRTRHYDEARRINAELQHLGPTLMTLTNTGVYRLSTREGASNAANPAGVRRLIKVGSDPTQEWIVGTFDRAGGGRAVLLVNDSYSFTGWPTVEFAVPATEVMEVDKATGVPHLVVDDSPELRGLQLSFGPGDGRLFLLPPP